VQDIKRAISIPQLRSVYNSEDIALFHNNVFLSVDFDLASGPFRHGTLLKLPTVPGAAIPV
jgi:hypothetical protein